MEPTDALKLIARAGYAARGVVYLIVGYFALLAAINWGKVSSTREALETILGQPHGVALLSLAIAGLFGHAGWRLAQSLLDADHHGADLKGYAADFSPSLVKKSRHRERILPLRCFTIIAMLFPSSSRAVASSSSAT